MRWLLLLLLLPAAHAFGIAQDYHENDTILVMQGESVLHKVTIQNDLDQPLLVLFTVSGDYVQIEGSGTMAANITVPAKSYNNFVYINISVPVDARPRDVGASFSTQPLVQQQGMVNMGVRLSDNFVIRVEENPAYRKPAVLRWVLLGLLVLAVGWVGYRGTAAAARWWKTRSRVPRGAFTAGGRHAETPEQLMKVILHMHEQEFKERKADIALWLYEKTKDRELYNKVLRTKTKEGVLRLL